MLWSLWWTKPLFWRGRRSVNACFSASSTTPACAVRLTRQPTIYLASASMTKATQAKLCQVATQVKSGSHNMVGRGARTCRFTRLSGHATAGLLMVVRLPRPRDGALQNYLPHQACGESELACNKTDKLDAGLGAGRGAPAGVARASLPMRRPQGGSRPGTQPAKVGIRLAHGCTFHRRPHRLA